MLNIEDKAKVLNLMLNSEYKGKVLIMLMLKSEDKAKVVNNIHG